MSFFVNAVNCDSVSVNAKALDVASLNASEVYKAYMYQPYIYFAALDDNRRLCIYKIRTSNMTLAGTASGNTTGNYVTSSLAIDLNGFLYVAASNYTRCEMLKINTANMSVIQRTQPSGVSQIYSLVSDLSSNIYGLAQGSGLGNGSNIDLIKFNSTLGFTGGNVSRLTANSEMSLLGSDGYLYINCNNGSDIARVNPVNMASQRLYRMGKSIVEADDGAIYGVYRKNIYKSLGGASATSYPSSMTADMRYVAFDKESGCFWVTANKIDNASVFKISKSGAVIRRLVEGNISSAGMIYDGLDGYMYCAVIWAGVHRILKLRKSNMSIVNSYTSTGIDIQTKTLMPHYIPAEVI